MTSNKHLLAILITVSGTLLMSIESLLIKLTTIDASLYAFYLGIFVFISTNFLLAVTQKKDIIKAYRTNLIIILLCGLFTGVSNFSFINAIKETSVANVVLITASSPLFSTLYAFFLYKEKSTKNVYIASFFIFVGLFVIFYEQLGKGQWLGNVYALVTVNMFSLIYVLMAKYKSASRLALTAIGGLSVSLFSLLLLDNADFSLDNNNLLILLLAGLLVSPMSRVLIGVGTKRLPASEVGLLTIIQTVMAPLWVWLVLNEIPPRAAFIGGSIILAALLVNSIYLIQKKGDRK